MSIALLDEVLVMYGRRYKHGKKEIKYIHLIKLEKMVRNCFLEVQEEDITVKNIELEISRKFIPP